MSDDKRRAAEEALFCEAVLEKSGTSVLLATLGSAPVEVWSHHPPGDVLDPASGAQWYYHSHPAGDGEIEHGHFHCFLRPAGTDGPVHHLVALGVDPFGRLVRLFTVNHWVVGDDFADAGATLPLLGRFDVQLARPDYLVNRWLTAIVRLYEDEIADLVRERDVVLAGHRPPEGGDPREDRSLEVLSERRVDLRKKAAGLGLLAAGRPSSATS